MEFYITHFNFTLDRSPKKFYKSVFLLFSIINTFDLFTIHITVENHVYKWWKICLHTHLKGC